MSSHKAASPAHNGADAGQLNFETALRIATIMADANERIFKLQSEAANAAFAENAKHLKSLLTAKDSSALILEWAGRYQANMRRILEVTRTCFEVVPQSQAEMAELVGEPFAPYARETQQYLDDFATAITEGHDAAAKAVEEVLAKATAGGSANRTPKKEKVA